MAAVIETKALTKRYGDRTVVDHLDLTVGEGEVFGLLGPNGAGKTTTILMLLGLTEITSGRARISGLDPARQSLAVKQIVGYLPDSVGFYDRLTGRENLRYTARLNRIEPALADERIDRALEDVGLSGAADDPVGTYSRGMLQRLGIADVLVKDPRVAILDEPTIAIDPEGVREMQRIIRSLADDRGTTVLLSSHLLQQMQPVCDRVGIFVEGRLVAAGTRDELASTQGGTFLVLSASGTPEAIAEAARSVGAEARADGLRWRIAGGPDLAPALVRALVERGIEIHELRQEGADLDAIYHHYFEEVSA